MFQSNNGKFSFFPPLFCVLCKEGEGEEWKGQKKREKIKIFSRGETGKFFFFWGFLGLVIEMILRSVEFCNGEHGGGE